MALRKVTFALGVLFDIGGACGGGYEADLLRAFLLYHYSLTIEHDINRLFDQFLGHVLAKHHNSTLSRVDLSFIQDKGMKLS